MPHLLVSPATALTAGIGTLIAFFYLRYMWLALRQAARTLDDPDDGRSDSFGHSFAGAIAAVVISLLAIAAYGFAPPLLYLGVALALASPVAVAYTFRRELDD